MQNPVEHATDGRYHSHDLKRLPCPIVPHEMSSQEAATPSSQTEVSHAEDADETSYKIPWS